MPRRIYTYEAGRGWEFWNLVSHHRRRVPVGRHADFCVQRGALRHKGKPAGDDPWDAWTLEWATTSPPPEYNFAKIPEVSSRRPLWDLKHPTDPDWKYE